MPEEIDLYGAGASLYDAAFSWTNDAELEFLRSQFGAPPRRVLEPMCGAGRLLARLAGAGYTTMGIDASPEMLELAQARFATSTLSGEWLLDSVEDFTLDTPCAAAVCPINSLGHLDGHASLVRHLEAVARALEPGAPYLVQIDLRSHAGVRSTLRQTDASNAWEFEYQQRPARCEWFGIAYDGEFEEQIARITLLDENVQFEYPHRMRVWDFAAWQQVIEASPFRQSAPFEAVSQNGVEQYVALPVDSGLTDRRLIWHRLTRR